MADAVEAFAGRDQAAGYLRLRDWLTRLYRTEFDGFIAANFDSPLSLVTPQLARLAALGGFRRWARVVERFITDERLRRVFTFQSLYAGVPPHRALAVYAVIAYMDTVAGVYFPRGGMRALPDALAAAAADAGVRFEYSSPVTTLERSGDRVTAVHTDGGNRVECDAVVLTTELPQTYRLLSRTPRRPLRLRPAPSAVVAHFGCKPVQSRRAPHDPVRRGVAADVRRHHPRRPADGRPVTARDPPHRRRPVARTGRPRAAVCAGAGAEPDPGRSRLGRDRRHLRRGDARHRAGTVARDRRRHRAVARCHARRLGPPGHGRRHAVRAWRTPSAKPGRSGRPTPCAASPTPCSPARRPCRASGCRPRCSPGASPPTGSPDRCAGVPHAG